MPYIPIWKDTFVDLGAVDVSTFTVTLDSDQSVLYSGKAVRRPDEATLRVRVNDIIADLLGRNLLTLQDPFTDYAAFLAGVTVSGNGVSQQLSFTNDWSYDYGKTYGTAFILSDPINGLLDGRQTFAVTGVFSGNENAVFTKANGSTTSAAVGITGEGTYKVDLSTIANLAAVTLGGKTWRVDGSCRTWVLHYINAYGGWDSLLIRGGGKQIDQITRYEHRRSYDNVAAMNRGRVNYLNDITTRWELHSGWLSDDESSRVHELMRSVLVYLEDVTAGVMLPVVIADNEQETKTYQNQGRRMVDYTFTVELAADRFRK